MENSTPLRFFKIVKLGLNTGFSMFEVLLRESQVNNRAEQYHVLYWCIGSFVVDISVPKYHAVLVSAVRRVWVVRPAQQVARYLQCPVWISGAIFAKP